jgi:hypothetical protein
MASAVGKWDGSPTLSPGGATEPGILPLFLRPFGASSLVDAFPHGVSRGLPSTSPPGLKTSPAQGQYHRPVNRSWTEHLGLSPIYLVITQRKPT